MYEYENFKGANRRRNFNVRVYTSKFENKIIELI